MISSDFPVRSCIVCRSKFSKSALLRLVMDLHGRMQVDYGQLMPGRGAYVCNNPKCIENLKDKHLHNAWRKYNLSGQHAHGLRGRLYKSFGKTEVRV